jgi:hypothetical protein
VHYYKPLLSSPEVPQSLNCWECASSPIDSR